MSLELGQVDVRSLSSVSLKQRKRLPNLPGVYFVFNDEDQCLYIGMTESLVLRWLNHNKLKELQKLEGVRIAWLEWEDTESLSQAKIFFIKALRPILNVRGVRSIKFPRLLVNNPNPLFTDKQNELLNFTLSVLSEETDVDIATWSRWLNGTRSPTLDTLRKLAFDLSMLLLEFIEVFEERRSRTMQSKKSA